MFVILETYLRQLTYRVIIQCFVHHRKAGDLNSGRNIMADCDAGRVKNNEFVVGSDSNPAIFQLSTASNIEGIGWQAILRVVPAKLSFKWMIAHNACGSCHPDKTSFV